MRPEKKFQNKVNDYLNDLKKHGINIFFQKRYPSGFNYKKGLPDFYILYKGVHYEIELKAPGGERSAMQEKYEMILKKAGATYWLVDNIDEFKTKFQKLLKE